MKCSLSVSLSETIIWQLLPSHPSVYCVTLAMAVMTNKSRSLPWLAQHYNSACLFCASVVVARSLEAAQERDAGRVTVGGLEIIYNYNYK